jgi:hypothetical protein
MSAYYVMGYTMYSLTKIMNSSPVNYHSTITQYTTRHQNYSLLSHE